MIHSVVSVSGVQQSDSVIHIHVSILFQMLLPYRWSSGLRFELASVGAFPPRKPANSTNPRRPPAPRPTPQQAAEASQPSPAEDSLLPGQARPQGVIGPPWKREFAFFFNPGHLTRTRPNLSRKSWSPRPDTDHFSSPALPINSTQNLIKPS